MIWQPLTWWKSWWFCSWKLALLWGALELVWYWLWLPYLCHVWNKSTKTMSKVAYGWGSLFHPVQRFSVVCEGWIVCLFIQADNLSLMGKQIKRDLKYTHYTRRRSSTGTGASNASKIQAHLWVGITIGALTPPNVHLILSGFLIDGVVKVNSVSVLQSVVPPQQQATDSPHKDDHYTRKT